MSKFYWFGDSWVEGSELELFVPDSEKGSYTFGGLVSKHYHAEFVNLGQPGSGINYIPYALNKVARAVSKDDTLFFCLSGSARVFFLNENGEAKFCHPCGWLPDIIQHEANSKWYKFFDNDIQRAYTYNMSINLLYWWSRSLGATCYFMNLFSTEEGSYYNHVPEDRWLIPRDRCLANALFPISGHQNYQDIIVNDMPFLKTAEWEEQKKAVEKYVRPCHIHPNLAGHKKIAEHIIELLDERNEL